MNANDRRGEVASEQRPQFDAPDWWIFRGNGRPIRDTSLDRLLPPPPPWRQFSGGPLPKNDVPPPDDGETTRRLGHENASLDDFADPHETDMVNAALYLRRPLLITGPPGAGKSSIAFRISRELRLGRVIRWHITSHSTFKQGLYLYDAIGRAEAIATRHAAMRGTSTDADPECVDQVVSNDRLGDFVRLGPLGTAFLPSRLPRVLLIDELDKSEMDLPNDLLGIFEEGSFTIPELERVRSHMPEVRVFTDDPDRMATITGGRVRCRAFPVVVITSNDERDFPPAFLRRCLQFAIPPPTEEKLAAMAAAHLRDAPRERLVEVVREFVTSTGDELPADRLLDALFMATSGAYDPNRESWPRLRDALWHQLRRRM